MCSFYLHNILRTRYRQLLMGPSRHFTFCFSFHMTTVVQVLHYKYLVHAKISTPTNGSASGSRTSAVDAVALY